MPSFQSILVVVDGRSESSAVVERGVVLARKTGARVTVIDIEAACVPFREATARRAGPAGRRRRDAT
jgi:nucleotide-binding universal stress UspA family protein